MNKSKHVIHVGSLSIANNSRCFYLDCHPNTNNHHIIIIVFITFTMFSTQLVSSETFYIMRIIEFAHFIMHKNHIWVNFGARRTFTDSTRSTVPLVFLLSLSLSTFFSILQYRESHMNCVACKMKRTKTNCIRPMSSRHRSMRLNV